MKYQLNTKMVVSLLATTLIVSGLAYAATTITNTSQTVVNNDIMSAAWFNDVNSKIANLSTKMTNVESNSLTDINNKLASINSKIAALEAAGATSNTRQFGGTFEAIWERDGNGRYLTDRSRCWQANPYTGTCTCPPGFSEMLIGMTFHYSPWDGAGFVCYK